MVRTVLGEVELSADRAILPHEHLVIDYRQKTGGSAPVSRELEDTCVARLAGLLVLGVQAIVDCTPPGYGRDIAFLRRVSERSGVHIIASTGTFCEIWSPQPAWVTERSVGALASAFLAELDRDCGVIKVATSPQVTPAEERALRAAAIAQRESGVSIVSHTSGGLAEYQLDLYQDDGADLSKVLISHVCAESEPLEYAIRIARRGAYVGLDRIGHAAHDDTHWLTIIAGLAAAGLHDRILLSHDSVQAFTGPNAISGHTFSDIAYLPATFTAALKPSADFPDPFRRLVAVNPARWLASKRVPA